MSVNGAYDRRDGRLRECKDLTAGSIMKLSTFKGYGILLAVVLASQVMFGCGDDGGSDVGVVPPPTTAPTQPPSTPAPLVPPTISISVPSNVAVGESVTISASLATPEGLESVTASVNGPGLALTQTFSPGEIGCLAGSSSCETGVVVDIPAGFSGSYNYSVTVTDLAGQTATQSGSFTVS
jgi:hypothetical protein